MSADVETALRGPQAFAIARRALDAMEENKVWPTATNFELWVNYVAASESELAREIDQLIKAGGPFTDGVGEQLAAKHLPKAKLNGEILEAGDALTKELASVSRAIESHQRTSEAYGQQLETASRSLDDQDTTSIKAMVDGLATATRKVQEENSHLESRLADTTAEVGRLRENLETLRRDAMTDGLTNLANRKAFDEALTEACAKADRDGGVLTVAVLDIDHFKKFNDTWGHQTGDQVLRYVASVISRCSPAPRLAARYGGEEFAVIFPGEHAAAAAAVLDAIREEVSSRVLKRRSTDENLGAVTLSAGVAERKAREDIMGLVDRADAALYTSKRNGRNRTTSAEDVANAA